MDESILQRKVELERQKQHIIDSLPHLHGFDWYPYQKEFLSVHKEIQVLCCANQLGKTTILLAKLVNLATDLKLWKKYWEKPPVTFIYMLPNQKLHDEAARTKWESVLPRNEYKKHPIYGWEWVRRGKSYLGIEFNSGVKILFWSFGMSNTNRQSISASVVAFDEEPDAEIIPEVHTRTSAIRIAQGNRKNAWGGFKIFAFTPTKSQNFFREVLEETGRKERWPVSDGNVWKKCVSLYDCQKHVSGKKSIWTRRKIDKIKKTLPTEAEIKRRVYGRFQASEDLVYPQYSREKNNIDFIPALPGYLYYAGIDYGSGGTAHPSAIAFVAVNKAYNKGYVTDVWIGDNGELTTCSDVIEKYKSMIRGRTIVQAFYDWGAKDLHTFAMRAGLNLNKANKDHKIGEDLLNALFKNRMLWICDTDYHTNVTSTQFTTFVKKKNVKKEFDDGIDAVRYAISSIPWDVENPGEISHATKREIEQTAKALPRATYRDGTPRWGAQAKERSYFEEELKEWGDMFGEF